MLSQDLGRCQQTNEGESIKSRDTTSTENSKDACTIA